MVRFSPSCFRPRLRKVQRVRCLPPRCTLLVHQNVPMCPHRCRRQTLPLCGRISQTETSSLLSPNASDSWKCCSSHRAADSTRRPNSSFVRCFFCPFERPSFCLRRTRTPTSSCVSVAFSSRMTLPKAAPRLSWLAQRAWDMEVKNNKPEEIVSSFPNVTVCGPTRTRWKNYTSLRSVQSSPS